MSPRNHLCLIQVYSLEDHIARVRTLIDRMLDQYGTVNTLFGEEERSKEPLPEFEHLRTTFAAWTGYDIGTRGVLAAQDGFVAVLHAIADAYAADHITEVLNLVMTRPKFGIDAQMRTDWSQYLC